MSTDLDINLADPLAQWHAWRAQGIGGSDIAAIMGVSTWASPWSLWAAKVQLTEPSPETPRQRLGKRMEPVIAAEFHDETGLYVAGEQTWCEHRENEWARCTVDGFIFDGDAVASIDEALGGFEAKSDGRFAWPEGIPVGYQAQAQWSMYVTGLDHWWFGVIHGGLNFKTYELPRDQADIDLMVERAAEFWQLVESRTPPPMDGSDATARAIEQIWGSEDPGKRADLDHLADRIAQRAELKDAVKQANAELKAIDNEIREAMKDAELGFVAGRPVFSCRTTEVYGPIIRPGYSFRALRPANKKDRDNA